MDKEGILKKEDDPPLLSVELSKGVTGYRVYEPILEEKKDDQDLDPPVMLCLHGFSNFSYCFNPLAQVLQKNGVRCITFDFYGRGHTPWPKGSTICDDKLLVSQTKELVEKLKIPIPFCLLGLSMGGAVAIQFADQYPDLVASLILIGPAGLPLPKPCVAKVVECCCLGDLIMCCFGGGSLVSGQKRDFFDLKGNKESIELEERMIRWQQRNTRGYMKAIHSTLRNFPLDRLRDTFQRVGKHRRRGLVIWGNRDSVCPYKPNAAFVEDCMPHLRLVTITDCGHMVLFEKFKAVQKVILAFVSGGIKRKLSSKPSSIADEPSQPSQLPPSRPTSPVSRGSDELPPPLVKASEDPPDTKITSKEYENGTAVPETVEETGEGDVVVGSNRDSVVSSASDTSTNLMGTSL